MAGVAHALTPLIKMYINLTYRIRWFGHVMRKQDTRLPKKLFTLELTGRRPIRRPRTRWRDQVKQDLERRGLSWTDVTSKSLWNDENIGGGYLILDPRNQGHENG